MHYASIEQLNSAIAHTLFAVRDLQANGYHTGACPYLMGSTHIIECEGPGFVEAGAH